MFSIQLFKPFLILEQFFQKYNFLTPVNLRFFKKLKILTLRTQWLIRGPYQGRGGTLEVSDF